MKGQQLVTLRSFTRWAWLPLRLLMRCFMTTSGRLDPRAAVSLLNAELPGEPVAWPESGPWRASPSRPNGQAKAAQRTPLPECSLWGLERMRPLLARVPSNIMLVAVVVQLLIPLHSTCPSREKSHHAASSGAWRRLVRLQLLGSLAMISEIALVLALASTASGAHASCQSSGQVRRRRSSGALAATTVTRSTGPH